MSERRENLLSIRIRNARLEGGLESASARRVARRIRTGLARRGLTMAQREGVLHDMLLMMVEAEAAGGDPVQALLGDADAAAADVDIEAYCDSIAAECSRLPTALVVIRFFALMVLALAAVLAVHLAWRLGRYQGWLPWPEVSLRTLDSALLVLECMLVPVIFTAAQAVSSAIRRNPWPHALPAVVTPPLFALALQGIASTTSLFVPNGLWAFDPSAMSVVTNFMGALALGISDSPWVIVNRFALIAGVLAPAVVAAAVIYAIERRDPSR